MTIPKTPKPPLPPPPYTQAEVARLFRVDSKTVHRWRKQGKIPFFLTPGGHGRYPRESTDAMLAKAGRP